MSVYKCVCMQLESCSKHSKTLATIHFHVQKVDTSLCVTVIEFNCHVPRVRGPTIDSEPLSGRSEDTHPPLYSKEHPSVILSKVRHRRAAITAINRKFSPRLTHSVSEGIHQTIRYKERVKRHLKLLKYGRHGSNCVFKNVRKELVRA